MFAEDEYIEASQIIEETLPDYENADSQVGSEQEQDNFFVGMHFQGIDPEAIKQVETEPDNLDEVLKTIEKE